MAFLIGDQLLSYLSISLSWSEALEEQIAQLLQNARDAWPKINLSTETFIAYLAPRILTEDDLAQTLSQIHLTDLYWACGLVQNDPAALAAFHEQISPLVQKALRRQNIGAEQIEDFSNNLFIKLFFLGPQGQLPKIVLYNGRGELGAWISVVATREAIDWQRRTKKEQPLDDQKIADLTYPEDDLELRYLKVLYRHEFAQAFTAAFAQLSERERVLLRQSLLDGLTIDQLAPLYQTHRSTVARWLSSAREKLLKTTKDELANRLNIDPAETESIMRLIQSRFELSLRQVFKQQS